MQTLKPNQITQVVARCKHRSEQHLNEQLLNRREFKFVASQGFWVRPGSTTRLWVEGPYFVVFHQGDAPDKPSYHGSGLKELAEALEAICG